MSPSNTPAANDDVIKPTILDDETYNASDELKEVATQIRESGKEYKTPNVSGFDLIHGRAQAKAFAGLTPDEFITYVKNFLERDTAGFTGLKYKDSIYKPKMISQFM